MGYLQEDKFMKIRICEIRQLVRDAINEASNIDLRGLAAFTFTRAGCRHAVLYFPDVLKDVLEHTSPTGDIVQNIRFSTAICGYLQLEPSDDECTDAWVASNIAGFGLGKIMYGIAYALSPSGRVMPSRDMLTSSSRSAWIKASKSGRKSTPLVGCEDMYNDPALDAVYESEGWEAEMLNKLENEHATTMSSLKSLKPAFVESALKNAGMLYFDDNYDPKTRV